MLPLAAYADRLSVRPGETIRFQVANATGQSVSTRLARVVCADANPAGTGILVEPVDSAVRQVTEPGPQRVPHGSYVAVDDVDGWFAGSSFTLLCRVFPTLRNGHNQALIARLDGVGSGVGLMLCATGHLRAVMGGGTTLQGPRSQRSLALRHWYLVWLTYDAQRHRLEVGDVLLRPDLGRDRELSVSAHELGADATPRCSGPLLMGAANALQPTAHFNGKLEAPLVYDRVLTLDEVSTIANGAEVQGAVAAWDFAREVGTSQALDAGPNGKHGLTVNSPARAMTGWRWDGSQMCFRHAPAHYGAIHFHEDDLDDCLWPTCFEWTVPDGTRSGVYALVLSAGEDEENVPFHVVPSKGRRTADIAVLVSTFTYTVYANHARPEWDRDPEWQAAWIRQSDEWGGYPNNPGAHREYGLSTYNVHPDLSGISVASWHRPMLNVRIGYLTYPYPNLRGSGLRHFPADSHLTAWLESRGLDYDVITDQELHDEGYDLIKDYPVVTTGTHPEYHTRTTLDALSAYRDRGGRLCYLGGNGFYWKVALSPERDGIIEIRRGEGGIRAWAAEPGEYYNQFDGEYGGMWRRNGRPPQALAGIGFTAQGNFHGSHYRKREAATDARAAWIFEGVPGNTFGNHGLSAHGAAGFELDRMDVRLGSPGHALVVASSENHPPDAPWVLVPEEQLTHIQTWAGDPARDLIRADMTFFETPAGGAVFATGSITYCGSLLTNRGDNDVSRITENVFRRFLDPTPFSMPDG
jgi:N,N-dimethylformamidase